MNDKIIYTSTCTYPIVTIEGNESATDKINADIQAIVDDFYADTSYPEWAKDDYDLEEMGFQEKYAYDGPKTILMQTEEVCSFDLNGDSQGEKIQFYIEQPGSTRTKLHFIINGTDYALQHEELASQFSDNNYMFCWAKCFLYDMDTEDYAIEIAFQMKNEDNMIPTTFFYRYDKNGQLNYLGMAESGVTNPTIV